MSSNCNTCSKSLMWFVILFLWVVVLFSISCGGSSVSSPSKDAILVESSSEDVPAAEGSNGFDNWSMKVTDGGQSVYVTNESGGPGSTYGCVVWYRLPDPPVPPGKEVDRSCGTVPENGTVKFTTKEQLCADRFQIDWEVGGNAREWKVVDYRDKPCTSVCDCAPGYCCVDDQCVPCGGCVYGPWEKVKEEKNECKDGKQINFFYYERSVISGGEQCTDTRKKEREELPCPKPTPTPCISEWVEQPPIYSEWGECKVQPHIWPTCESPCHQYRTVTIEEKDTCTGKTRVKKTYNESKDCVCPSTCQPKNIPTETGLICYSQNPWGNGNNPENMCGYYGLVPVGKEEGERGGPVFGYDATLAITHWGGADCGRGAQGYTFSQNVRVGDPNTQPGRGGWSFTQYCSCR